MRPVAYTPDNVAKCWCGQCPVQRESDCAKQRYEASKPGIQQGQMPKPGELAGLYCVTGKAPCDDINPNQRCLCTECLVWGEHNLVSNHYCVQGSAEEVAG